VFGDKITEPASAVEVAPGVRRIRILPPFVLDQINLWLLEDGGGWTLFDCGLDQRPAIERRKRFFAARVTALEIDRSVVTHYRAYHSEMKGRHSKWWNAPRRVTEGGCLAALVLHLEPPGHHRGSMVDLFRSHRLPQSRLEGMKGFSGVFRRLTVELPPPRCHRALFRPAREHVGPPVARFALPRAAWPVRTVAGATGRAPRRSAGCLYRTPERRGSGARPLSPAARRSRLVSCAGRVQRPPQSPVACRSRSTRASSGRRAAVHRPAWGRLQ